jgi:hypothetical protein
MAHTDMREVFALITFIVLLWVGWKQSYQDHLAELLGEPAVRTKRPVPRQVVANTVAVDEDAPAKDAWMWDRGKLDSPNQMKSSHGR